MNSFRFLVILSLITAFSGCTTIDIYEKNADIPAHEWKNSFRPEFDFTIKDTLTRYRVYLVLRHTDKYNFNNIFINLYVKGPGQDTASRFQRDILLATNEKGWLGTGMDDIYEQRRELTQPLSLRAGDYHFAIEQIMREDPLKNVLNVGLRVEKEK